MLNLTIRVLLRELLNRMDSGSCNISSEEQSVIMSILANIAYPNYRMSKIQACDYIGVSRATFDNYVHDGLIPKGFKLEGFKELSWNKLDLDMFLAKLT